ncbi:MAG: protoporphyrinogen oxidase [Thermomicrobium sp.]|nr:protoporphyrinogen oxidase [Thermomicrobium sp.]
MNRASLHLAVVGGGITGLAAAWELERSSSGIQVTVLEESARLGGWIRTDRWGEVLIEHGPDSWVASKRSATEFACSLGLAAELVGLRASPAGAGIVSGGRLVPLPDGLSLLVPTRLRPLFTSPLLSPWGKLRLLGDLFLPPRANDEDESIGAFVRRRFGREFFERIAEPLLAGIYAGDAERLSVLATYPQLREWERQAGSVLRGVLRAAGSRVAAAAVSSPAAKSWRSAPQAATDGFEAARETPNTSAGDCSNSVDVPQSPFLSLRGGMERLVAGASQSLRCTTVRLGTAVRGLRATGTGFTLELSTGDELAVDGVILAVPAWRAAELVAALDRQAAMLLEGILYASSAAVTLIYARAALDAVARGRGFLVPACEGRAISAVTWVTNKFEGRAPKELGVARVFFRERANRATTDAVPETLVAVALHELQVLTGLRAEPLHAVVSKHERALPQYLVGHRSRVAEVRRRLATWPGLALAGAAYDGVGIPDCIASGQRAARAVLAAVGAGRR